MDVRRDQLGLTIRCRHFKLALEIWKRNMAQSRDSEGLQMAPLTCSVAQKVFKINIKDWKERAEAREDRLKLPVTMAVHG
jgi:hypothetical protein